MQHKAVFFDVPSFRYPVTNSYKTGFIADEHGIHPVCNCPEFTTGDLACYRMPSATGCVHTDHVMSVLGNNIGVGDLSEFLTNRAMHAELQQLLKEKWTLPDVMRVRNMYLVRQLAPQMQLSPLLSRISIRSRQLSISQQKHAWRTFCQQQGYGKNDPALGSGWIHPLFTLRFEFETGVPRYNASTIRANKLFPSTDPSIHVPHPYKGCEIKTGFVTGLKQVADYLFGLYQWFREQGIVTNKTCGMHIHFENMHAKNSYELATLFALWRLLETNYTVNIVSNDRINNRFCELWQSIWPLWPVQNDVRFDEFVNHTASNINDLYLDRYRALNFKAREKHGSIEVRLPHVSFNFAKWPDGFTDYAAMSAIGMTAYMQGVFNLWHQTLEDKRIGEKVKQIASEPPNPTNMLQLLTLMGLHGKAVPSRLKEMEVAGVKGIDNIIIASMAIKVPALRPYLQEKTELTIQEETIIEGKKTLQPDPSLNWDASATTLTI